MTSTEILGKLTGVKTGGSGWMARCPAHEDGLASLAVSEGADGRILLYCHAGCTTGGILGALGLSLVDLFPQTGHMELVAQLERVDEVDLD